MTQEHFSKLEQMYYAAPLHKFYDSLQIKISKGICEIELDLEEKYFHSGGAVHGSVFFKLLDDACYFAIQSQLEDQFIVTAKFHVDLQRPLKTGRVKAIGEVIRLSFDEYFAKSTLYDDKGRVVATGTGQFMKTKLPLERIESY
ncbi:MAG: PaaI family thioesterase [Crocinitomicaceae bacterium]